MDEKQWLACNDPTPMLTFLSGKSSSRRLRLFLCACARRVWHFVREEACHEAVQIAERHADGQVSQEELETALLAARRVAWQIPDDADAPLDEVRSDWAAAVAAWAAEPVGTFSVTGAPFADEDTKLFFHVLFSTISNVVWETAARITEQLTQASLLRDLFGNPFRPVTLSPAWRTPTVLSLAQSAYDHRILPGGTLDPERLAVLADALEESGCDNAEILGHLRGDGPHWRGCWVVDLLLGQP
jgi:hypothetical protein